MRNTLLLTAVALYSVACASSVPAPQATPAPVAPLSAHKLDADQFLEELEEAHNLILARAEKPAVKEALPVVDVDAATSIPIPQHRTIDSAVRLFSVDMKESIQTSLIRSGRYRALIDQALEAEKLPKGLAYLPVIESAYLPNLTSRAGAHGIWQFMPETAREYGLRVDWWVDERADPVESTKAAAAYLRDLNRMFNGDWALTLAAYNCGPGRVRRKLAEYGASTFWELLEQSALPKETRGYVPTFYATLLIASDPATYGFKLGEVNGVDAEIDAKRVEVEGPVSLRFVAETAGVDEDVLKELNPAFRRGIVPPGRAAVRVPSKAAGTLHARAKTLRHDDDYLKVCSFTLRRGDSIERLARAIGTKPETLLEMNEIKSARPGDSILLPVRARELGTLLAHSENEDVFYAVRKGDTLYSIAKQHDLSVTELREINELSKEATLRIGQKLRVSAPRVLAAGGM
ncbi:MAG TPA: transglycosylase SLT domain-containing protein [Thermoanaerobaculia bacterium]|jgi:membrane-bound lytic murein transglycosylase D